MSSPHSTTARRVLLPPPPSRPRRVAVPVGSVSTSALASVALGLAVGTALPGLLASLAVTTVAIVTGWGFDRVIGAARARRHERTRFSRALGEVEANVARLRSARARELADWYPTSDRVGVGGSAPRVGSALVLGVGRASSGLVLEGRPEDGLDPDDPATGRLARLRTEAAVLDDAPLCVPLGSTVRVVGPPVVAEAVASGFRRQLRTAGASPSEATSAIDCVLVPPGPPARARPSSETRPVDAVVFIGPDGAAVVTQKGGRPCRQPLRVAFVSVRDEVASCG